MPPSLSLSRARDVVLIESYNSLEDDGVSSAFLQHPQTGTGIAVDRKGDVAEVPSQQWSEFLGCIADAKKTLKENGGGSWSRPQWQSCSADFFFDLGPAATKEEFLKFQFSGHLVDENEPEEILRYVNGRQSIVPEIPPALENVESAVSTLKEGNLLPKRDYARFAVAVLVEGIQGHKTTSFNVEFDTLDITAFNKLAELLSRLTDLVIRIIIPETSAMLMITRLMHLPAALDDIDDEFAQRTARLATLSGFETGFTLHPPWDGYEDIPAAPTEQLQSVPLSAFVRRARRAVPEPNVVKA
ncbi:hypothetical protein K438DRAFT_1975857 [Mycena galopus ATCC 62051]|nr:hypothetical protein K438DRAFT_1975857 [Mycena galopus ATCC 62051]